MCVCVHIYIYTFVYIFMCVCTYIHTDTHTQARVHVYTDTHPHLENIGGYYSLAERRVIIFSCYDTGFSFRTSSAMLGEAGQGLQG